MNRLSSHLDEQLCAGFISSTSPEHRRSATHRLAEVFECASADAQLLAIQSSHRFSNQTSADEDAQQCSHACRYTVFMIAFLASLIHLSCYLIFQRRCDRRNDTIIFTVLLLMRGAFTCSRKFFPIVLLSISRNSFVWSTVE